MSLMFANAKLFNGDVSNFDTSSVTNMQSMFSGASSFNRDLLWDTSSVTNMNGMFSRASSFTGDVSSFNTSSVTGMSKMFYQASSFNQDLSNFDTSKVTNTRSMFNGATSFNRDLSNFDTSRVVKMDSMFSGATSFNIDVSSFDISSVSHMSYMFSGASSYNQDLCAWQDYFSYSADTSNIFTNSNCTYQDTPQEAQNGPFCSFDCGAPSVSPSSSLAPTTSPKPTQSPTESFSPTDTCYWIDIVVVFDNYPEDTSWQLQKISDSGNNDVLMTFNGKEANTLQSESMCLKVGEYQFTIYDKYGDGILAPGHYNVTSEGNLIVQGGEFTLGETTSFSIPFVSGSAISTSTIWILVQPLIGKDHIPNPSNSKAKGLN